MASLYNAAVQNHVALIVHNRTYSTLTTQQKLLQDNNWVTGEPGGHAGDSQTKVRRFANYLFADGLDSLPEDWIQWLKWEIAATCAAGVQPERAAEYRRHRDEAMQAALQTYSRVDSSDPMDSDDQIKNTVLGIRRYVMANCIRQSPPFYAQPELIDGALRASIYELWNYSAWSWRAVNSLTFTIGTSGISQTITVSTPVSQVYSNRLYYNDSREYMVNCEPDQMQHELSKNYDPGKPQKFRITRAKAGTLTILLDRVPDKQYTMRGDFLAACPNLSIYEDPISEVDQTGLVTLLPDNFLDLLKRMTLQRILVDAGRREGYAIEAAIQDDLADLETRDRIGSPVKESDYSSARQVIVDQFHSGGGVIGGGL